MAILSPRIGFLRAARFTCVLAGVLSLGVAAAAQTVIYDDDFSGSASDHLDARAPVTAAGEAGGSADATWTSGGYWKADGTVANGPDSDNVPYRNSFTDNGLLPFRPEPGHRYTLSATLTRPVDSPNHWLWLGFAGESLEGGGPAGRPNSGKRGLGWIIAPISGGFQTFVGPATEGGRARAKPPVEPGQPFELRVVLDTKTDPANWRLEWFVDGRSVRGPHPLEGTTVAGETITQVGFGRFANAGGSISRFTLAVE